MVVKNALSAEDEEMSQESIYIKYYFSNRKIQLTISDQTVTKSVNHGFPQGSTCSPGYWYTLYDDLLNQDLPEGCNLLAYADDALLLLKVSRA